MAVNACGRHNGAVRRIPQHVAQRHHLCCDLDIEGNDVETAARVQDMRNS